MLRYWVALWVFLMMLALASLAYPADVTVRFQWNASTGAVAGYKLYRGLESGKYTANVEIPGTGTTGAMPMDNATSHFVAATAYDAAKRESAYSNEILCHPVLTSIGPGGSITPSGPFFVQNGNGVVFTIAPGAGKYINSVSINGASVGAASTYTLSNVQQRTVINVDTQPLPVVGAFDYDTVIPVKATDAIMVELPPREVETYEVRLYNFERKTYQNLVASTLLARPITVTKTGHYIVEYRGCNGVGTGRVCTSWAPSTDPLIGPRTRKPDGALISRGWWIYQFVRPPGGIEIR